jgi:hypothetical protein
MVMRMIMLVIMFVVMLVIMFVIVFVNMVVCRIMRVSILTVFMALGAVVVLATRSMLVFLVSMSLLI